jgi:hypothetical protein
MSHISVAIVTGGLLLLATTATLAEEPKQGSELPVISRPDAKETSQEAARACGAEQLDQEHSNASPPMSGVLSDGALQWRAIRLSDGLGEFLLEGNARIAFARYIVCADTINFNGRVLHARGNAVAVDPGGTILRATEIKLGPAATEAFKNSLVGRSR